MVKNLRLGHTTVLVTRPGKRGVELVQTLRAMGATAHDAGVMEIELQGHTQAMRTALTNINPSAILVFVSVHAVNAVANTLSLTATTLPDDIRVAAVGATTADALEEAGIKVTYTPKAEMNSEGLLALFQKMDLTGQQIIIFRGQSGRELLGQALRQRGASVVELQSYQRRYLCPDLSDILSGFTSEQQCSVILTSVDLLTALERCLDREQREVIYAWDMVTLSQRIADAALAAGFTGRIAVARETNNAGLVEALLRLSDCPPDTGLPV